MGLELLGRVLALCVALAATETLHGIVRTVWLVPRIGKARAQAWAIYSGCALAFLVCLWGVPMVGLRGLPALATLGLVLAAFMAGFDLALGHWLLRRPWSRALDDLRPSTGNRLAYGLAWLAACPLMIGAW